MPHGSPTRQIISVCSVSPPTNEPLANDDRLDWPPPGRGSRLTPLSSYFKAPIVLHSAGTRYLWTYCLGLHYDILTLYRCGLTPSVLLCQCFCEVGRVTIALSSSPQFMDFLVGAIDYNNVIIFVFYTIKSLFEDNAKETSILSPISSIYA